MVGERRDGGAARVLVLAGLILVGFCFCTQLSAVAGFFAGVPVTAVCAPVGLALAVAIAWGGGRWPAREVALAALAAIAVIALSCWAASLFVDNSYDGNGYQKAAVVQMANGWVPLQGSVGERTLFQELYGSSNYIAMRTVLWVDHYAEGPWEIAASLYVLTGNLESGKAYTLILMFAVGLLLAGYLRLRGFRGWQCAVIALVAAVNPITVVQFKVYYVDGALMMSLLALIVGFAMALDGRCPFARRVSGPLVFMAFCVCTNVKFTGLAYAGVFSLAFAVAVIAVGVRRPDELSRRQVLGWGAVLVGAVAFAVGVLGFAPYVTNFLAEGHPFYPLFGPNAADIMEGNTPVGFSDMGVLERIATGLLAPAADTHGGGEAIAYPFKVPLTVNPDELPPLAKCDLRISGFGVLYSGIFILCVACLPFLLVVCARRCRLLFRMALLYLVPSVLLMVAMGDSWWARYSCYGYFLCPLALTFLFWFGNEGRYRAQRVVGWLAGVVLALLMAANIGFFVRYNLVPAWQQTQEVKSTMASWKGQLADGTRELVIAGRDARLGLVYTLREAGVPFTYAGTALEGFDPDGEFLFGFYRMDSPFEEPMADKA